MDIPRRERVDDGSPLFHLNGDISEMSRILKECYKNVALVAPIEGVRYIEALVKGAIGPSIQLRMNDDGIKLMRGKQWIWAASFYGRKPKHILKGNSEKNERGTVQLGIREDKVLFKRNLFKLVVFLVVFGKENKPKTIQKNINWLDFHQSTLREIWAIFEEKSKANNRLFADLVFELVNPDIMTKGLKKTRQLKI